MTRKTQPLYSQTERQDDSGETRKSRPAFSITLEPGVRLGTQDEYEVVRVIAQETGEADVYLCRERANGSEVVVKLYRGRQGAKDDVLRALKGLRHPDIVTLLDYGFWQGHLFEAMEYGRGGSLSERLPQRPFTEGELRQVVLPQVLSGLELCHQMNPRIIHRDLKPSNIFFRDSAGLDVMIGDFGISSLLGEGETHRVTAPSRSPDYAAPEVYSSQMGLEADYYSLGITIVELFSGYSPWSGRTEYQVMHGNLSEEIPLPDTMSGELRQLVRGLTVKERHNRWGAEEVRRWLAREDVPVRRSGPATPAGVQPYTMPSGAKVRTAVEMADAIEAEWEEIKPDVLRGHISRWFATFDQDLARRLGQIEESGLGADLILFSFLYALDPERPFNMIAGHRITTPAQLAAALDRNDSSRQLGVDLLERGYLTLWLRVIGYEEISERWSRLPSSTRQDSGLALEALLRLMDPDLPSPSVQADRDSLDFGAVELGSSKELRLVIENPGRGYLAGVARLAEEVAGVSCSANLIRGNRTELLFRLNAAQLTAGTHANTTVEIETNGDRRISLPLRYEVALPASQTLSECLQWAAAGAALFGVLRCLLLLAGHDDWLGLSHSYVSVNEITARLMRGEVGIHAEFVVLLIPLVAGLTSAALAYRGSRNA